MGGGAGRGARALQGTALRVCPLLSKHAALAAPCDSRCRCCPPPCAQLKAGEVHASAAVATQLIKQHQPAELQVLGYTLLQHLVRMPNTCLVFGMAVSMPT